MDRPLPVELCVSKGREMGAWVGEMEDTMWCEHEQSHGSFLALLAPVAVCCKDREHGRESSRRKTTWREHEQRHANFRLRGKVPQSPLEERGSSECFSWRTRSFAYYTLTSGLE